jgi:hypothetical protein
MMVTDSTTSSSAAFTLTKNDDTKRIPIKNIGEMSSKNLFEILFIIISFKIFKKNESYLFSPKDF